MFSPGHHELEIDLLFFNESYGSPDSLSGLNALHVHVHVVVMNVSKRSRYQTHVVLQLHLACAAQQYRPKEVQRFLDEYPNLRADKTISRKTDVLNLLCPSYVHHVNVIYNLYRMRARVRVIAAHIGTRIRGRNLNIVSKPRVHCCFRVIHYTVDCTRRRRHERTATGYDRFHRVTIKIIVSLSIDRSRFDRDPGHRARCTSTLQMGRAAFFVRTKGDIYFMTGNRTRNVRVNQKK